MYLELKVSAWSRIPWQKELMTGQTLQDPHKPRTAEEGNPATDPKAERPSFGAEWSGRGRTSFRWNGNACCLSVFDCEWNGAAVHGPPLKFATWQADRRTATALP